MSASHPQLALLGFTPFERRSFQSFVELGREHGPRYEFTEELWRADCVVADADDEAAMARLLHAGTLLERSVLLGTRPYAGAALQLPRPINLVLVMRALDTLVGARPRPGARLATSADDPPPPRRVATRLVTLPDAPAPARDRADGAVEPPAAEFKAISGTSVATPEPVGQPLPAPPPGTRTADAGAASEPAAGRSSRHVQRVLDELAFRTATLPPDIDVRALAEQAAHPGPSLRETAPGAKASRARGGKGRTPLPMEHILVIDQDAATLRLIAVQLQRFGFQIHLAGHPDDAMRLLTQRFHAYVFMDPALLGLDALLVCRLARQIPPPDDDCATTVVLLADPAAPAAPLARALPAADGCLKKPLELQALFKLVGEREVARVAFADTARTTTII